MITAQPPNETLLCIHVGTTHGQQGNIRLIFQHELGISNVQSIKVETTELFNALIRRRHGDIDAEDDGTIHSEVLKNAIDLLQRFHRCAPLYLKMDAGHRGRHNNFFAKDVFCRTFCHDIDAFDNKDNPRMWVDVFHFFQAMKKIWDGSLLGGLRTSAQDMVAAGFDARGEVAKARARTRKGAVLWELMGLASKAIDRVGHTRPETWCIEAAIRVGMWRKRFESNRASLFRLPVEDDWGVFPADVLPENDVDAMMLFDELETKFRAFYAKCGEQMPEQATDLPGKPRTRVVTSETDNDSGQTQSEEISQQDGTSDVMSFSDGMSYSEEMCIRGGNSTSDQRGSGKERDPKKKEAYPFGRNSVTQRILRTDFMPHPLKEAYHHWVSTRRTFDQDNINHISPTEDPWKLSAPTDPTHKALEKAKTLITNVLHANGLKPDWNPGRPPSEQEGTPSEKEG